ncbi:ECF subfamily RNA polymerase sigma-24 subunit [Paenibacillus mucilaginosus 3016]|uniref:ECF subfamily RNA polymerase sigma-24 subunit n=1 Tax=Paenibacillus mucilaginosus 3016 TaxID=1116391 RepID=H6N9R4_9BACL|nr:RNA polymerase subunit sigma-24 [Paenibacillus mucilaginosus]AFC28221.1 ECF subfamily RNA polymerase sigma-24 subunit [Paenibacillus mucilaginosus 3016]WFA17042.1 RNA polymerase subunit sigma-24 [Paenibacillus mucilaginosus]
MFTVQGRRRPDAGGGEAEERADAGGGSGESGFTVSAGSGAPSGALAQRDSVEKELVERARSGDREAFGELVRMHRARALGWAGSLTRDAHMAEDIVDDLRRA